MVTPARAAAVAAGVVADRLIGEPWAGAHPVARFGQAMAVVERRIWADERRAGVVFAGLGVGVAALGGRRVTRRRPLIGLALATYVAVAGRALGDAAHTVAGDLERADLAAARAHLPALVGRNPDGLDEGEVVRAVVESVAENTVDAVTAPIFWALAAGAPGVAAYRAVNTLDAMVGHRSPRYERFGWASARVDDLANWLPARLTVVAVAAVRPARATAVWRAVRAQAPAHPSPNAGAAEAAFAAALGVRLGGANDYRGRVERRPYLGQGPPPSKADIDRAVTLSRDVTRAWIATVLAASLLGPPLRRRRRRAWPRSWSG